LERIYARFPSVHLDNIMPGKPKGLPKTGGRKKGTLNRSTVVVKEALELAFQGIGGVPALIEWAREERTEFYKLFAKLLPTYLRVAGPAGGAIQIHTSIDYTKIPDQELREYESLFARLNARAGSEMAPLQVGEVPPLAN
jgi:hypothetical protein